MISIEKSINVEKLPAVVFRIDVTSSVFAANSLVFVMTCSRICGSSLSNNCFFKAIFSAFKISICSINASILAGLFIVAAAAIRVIGTGCDLGSAPGGWLWLAGMGILSHYWKSATVSVLPPPSVNPYCDTACLVVLQ